MRVAVGGTHPSAIIQLTDLLGRLGHEVIDLGAGENPGGSFGVAAGVAGTVSQGDADCGILIGPAGEEMCAAANKYPGVRAGVCRDELMAEIARRYMDLNVICLPPDLGDQRALAEIVRIWLDAPYKTNRSPEDPASKR